MPISLPLILERPYMRTTLTKIDVYGETLTMKIDGDVISFHIFEAMRYLSEVHTCFSINAFDCVVHDIFGTTISKDALESALTQGLQLDLARSTRATTLSDEVEESVAVLQSLPHVSSKFNSTFTSLPIIDTKLVSFVSQAPKLELKPLPDHLKYSYLGEKDIFSHYCFESFGNRRRQPIKNPQRA